VFTYIDPKFAAVVREERRKFYRRELHGVRPVSLRCLKWLLAYAVLKTVWLPKGVYLLWLIKQQPREVQERIVSYLPAADGCLAHALDLYNTERYIEDMKSRGSLTLVAVQYRFGFVVVI
jgi:hypothetical protein